jgi:hypothetical protein
VATIEKGAPKVHRASEIRFSTTLSKISISPAKAHPKLSKVLTDEPCMRIAALH